MAKGPVNECVRQSPAQLPLVRFVSAIDRTHTLTSTPVLRQRCGA